MGVYLMSVHLTGVHLRACISVGNAFNSSAMMLGAPRFGLPGHSMLQVICVREKYT